VLLDIVLAGDLDGWQVLHDLRTDPAQLDLPVVVVSGLENHQLAATLGATDYLVKPIGRGALLGVLDRFALGPAAEILVVDDEPSARQLLGRMLRQAGFRARTAGGGEAAMREIARSAPDLVLLDLLMPGTDGFQVLEAVRTAPATRDLPVIVVTARDIAPAEAVWLRERTEAVLAKSALSLEALVEQVRGALPDPAARAAAGVAYPAAELVSS
jgi:CheY-like chemotaxis protein